MKNRVQSTKSIQLFLKCSYVQGALCEIFEEYDEAIHCHKETLKYCNFYHYFYGKISPYKMIAFLFCKKKMFDKALIYMKKLLKYSWLYQHKETELFCYENIAKIFFY